MLDELIAYLRAAMPKMRDTSSTVGQEIELVRAYLGIVPLAVRRPSDVRDRTGLPWGPAARMPPMMVLPLVDHAIAHGLAEAHAAGSIRIRSSIVEQTIRLEIADSGIGFLPEPGGTGIDDIRERLAELYGRDASLLLQKRDGGATEAVLELPVEQAAAAAVDVPNIVIDPGGVDTMSEWIRGSSMPAVQHKKTPPGSHRAAHSAKAT